MDAITWTLARKPDYGWPAEDGSPLRALPVYPHGREHLVFYVVEHSEERVVLKSIIPTED